VDEEILAAVFGRDEAEALVIVEPLHCSLHWISGFSIRRDWGWCDRPGA
jgi:hypothetical protein